MRQGRGDADYSSLFRQYFPAGAPSNGEDDQPQLAGIDVAKGTEAEKVPVAVETTAEVPSEAKAMGEVVPAPAVEETKVEPQVEVAGHTNAAAAPPAEAPAATAPSPADEAPKEAPQAPAAAVEAKPKEETVLTFPAPASEDETEEPRGLWGGFWRRRTDD
jgi:hypothetical protein